MPNTLNTAAEQARDALANLAAGKLDINIESLMRYAPTSTLSKEAAVLVLFGVLDDEPSASADFDGCPECVGENLDVLLLVRADTLRSHAGQPAFPGGKIDPEDYELARQQGVPVGRIAALREQEELDAIRPDLDGDQIMEILGLRPSRAVKIARDYLLELRMERGPLGEEAARQALLDWWASDDVRALAEEYQAQQAHWEAKVAEKKARKAAAKAAREVQGQ